MIIVRNIKISPDADFSNLKRLLSVALSVKLPDGASVSLQKRSIDARNKSRVHFICTFVLQAKDEKSLLLKLKKYGAEPYSPPVYHFLNAPLCNHRPVVTGFGPAGMFAALCLAKAGLRPIVIERGQDADSRKKSIDAFWRGGALHPDSNVQFGEGGAGTFSDGKLNTGVKDSRISAVLQIFAHHGAGEKILYDAKPHIGTDILINVVKSIRREIISLGGDVFFEHTLKGITVCEGAVAGITVTSPSDEKEIPCRALILAPGHSAGDTFLMLKNKGILMEPKAFSVGARIEHKQDSINRAQYGAFAGHPALGAADYRLSCHLENGRGVYTFCMCPGGYVVNASSEPDGVVTNGMSLSGRDGENANSAVLVGVNVEDFFRGDVLDGIYFQRSIERRAFAVGGGLPVCQTFGDFSKGVSSLSCKSIRPTALPGVKYGDIHDVLPEFVTAALKDGILLLDKKLRGFASPDALLTAPETRSSSPVRILRNTDGESTLTGLFPCGEGAGYAGGITSAAVDGMKTAEKVIKIISNSRI